MDRRGFLRGLFAAPAIVAASSLMPINPRLLFDGPPKLWGDGIHDDTAALQWMIDNARSDVTLDLGTGIYRLTGTVTLPKSRPLHIEGGDLRIDHSGYGLMIPCDGSTFKGVRIGHAPTSNPSALFMASEVE